MKIITKKVKEREPDDSLFGLLAAYKANSTYIRVLVNEEQKSALFQMTDNPRFFPALGQYEGFRQVSRSDMNVTRLFVKYLSPEHILDAMGETMGLKLTPKTGKVMNNLSYDYRRIFQLELPARFLPSLVTVVRKIVAMPPQKKYEIIEKYLANAAKPEMQD